MNAPSSRGWTKGDSGRDGGVLCTGVASLEGFPDATGVGRFDLVTPHRVHLFPPETEFLKPQTWHVQACAAAGKASSSSDCSASLSGSCVEVWRTRVILAELFKNPTQYSVCLTW